MSESSHQFSPQLSETLYAHLRGIAQNKLSHERPGHTLQATALVHEALMRMKVPGGADGQEPAFYWAAADAMRRVLIDHARARKAVKRGAGQPRLSWTEQAHNAASVSMHADLEEIESLDHAIQRLEVIDERAAGVVRLRFFAGLTVEQVAKAMNMTERMVKRDWEYARPWLLRELRRTRHTDERGDTPQ